MKGTRHGLTAAITLSAAGPAVAQSLPLGVESAPWWAVFAATMVGPAVTYAAGLFTRAALGASAAALHAVAQGRGVRGIAGAMASSLDGYLNSPPNPPQLPPSGEDRRNRGQE